MFFSAKHGWVKRTEESWTSHAWWKLTKSWQLYSSWFSSYILHTCSQKPSAYLKQRVQSGCILWLLLWNYACLHLLWLCVFRQDLLSVCSVKLMRYRSFLIVCDEQISVHRKDVVWSFSLPLSQSHIGTSNPREPGIWGKDWVCCLTLFLREMCICSSQRPNPPFLINTSPIGLIPTVVKFNQIISVNTVSRVGKMDLWL